MGGAGLLILGEATLAQAVESRLKADVRLLGIEVTQLPATLDAAASVAARSDIEVVLILWPGGVDTSLLGLVQALAVSSEGGARAVMVRSPAPLTEATRAALWQMCIADLAFGQQPLAADLADSLLATLRQARRNATVVAAAASSRTFAGARTLRDLADLALREFEQQGLGRAGALFCFHSRPSGHEARVIAAAGRYASGGVAPVAAVADGQAKAMVRRVLQRGRSEFRDDAAALHLQTPDGYDGVVYLSLERPLNAWEKSYATMQLQAIAAAIDQTQLAHRLLRTQHATVTTLATLAEYRDVDTGEHVARVARVVTEIAQALADRGDVAGVDSAFVEQIGLAAILHDVGKIAIPENILMKPGPLDAEERLAMQSHVSLGRDILLRTAKRSDNGELLLKAAQIAHYHHERYDGGGYPQGISGEDIPLAARIVALVDVFDALTSLRPYKKAWPVDAALDLIRSEAGKHFDPLVVEEFLRLEDRRKAARFTEWHDSMSVGSEDLDFDHRRLLGIINRLWLANSHGNRQVIEFVLDDLVNYTEFHFEREERLLRDAGYPDLDRHCAVHAAICRRLEEIRWEYFQGIHDELRNEILEFLKTWLNRHILEEDMSYSSYLASAAA